MNNKTFITLVMLTSFLLSCQHNEKHNLSIYRSLTNSLNGSNKVIASENGDFLQSLAAKLANPQTQKKALYWQPRAMLIHQRAKGVTEYIDKLKRELKDLAGSKVVNGKESFREDDINSVYKLFIAKDSGEKLKEKLSEFKQQILAVEPEITDKLGELINLTLNLSHESEATKSFDEVFFKDIPVAACLAVLTHFQNNVTIVENLTIGFCRYKVPEIDYGSIRF